jgi:hypothetical protein
VSGPRRTTEGRRYELTWAEAVMVCLVGWALLIGLAALLASCGHGQPQPCQPQNSLAQTGPSGGNGAGNRCEVRR